MYSRDFGGVFDTRNGRWDDESINPVVWYASEEQFRLLTHDYPQDRMLVLGAEGSGKTAGVLSKWLVLQVIKNAGQHIEGGAVAPTQKRLERLRQAVMEDCPPEWLRWRYMDGLMRFAVWPQVRFVSAHKSSEAEGSAIQGFDWGFSATDEQQDCIDANADIEARGRRAPGGRYMRMSTCTAKDSPDWRTFRDAWDTNPLCGLARLNGFSNPFVAPEHWHNLKQTLSARDYQRRVLAMDVGPERMVYTTWDRDTNVQPIPRIGARDVTEEALSRFGRGFGVLVGHDPGQLCDVSLILKAYKFGNEKGFRWYVVDEFTTTNTTSDEHAVQLARHLRENWGTNLLDRNGRPDPYSPRAHVRTDPHSETDNGTNKSVYHAFRHAGLDIYSAAYKQGKGSGKIPKESRIEMVCRLFKNAAGGSRLFVACDERRRPAAPKLVNAIELSERDESGKAENQRKGKRDLSHWPAALGYALWAFERLPETSLEVSDARTP